MDSEILNMGYRSPTTEILNPATLECSEIFIAPPNDSVDQPYRITNHVMNILFVKRHSIKFQALLPH